MDFSIQLLPDQQLAELIEVIHAADELGFRACYSADETYHKDMWILFAAAAPGTRRIRFGPEVSGVILKDPTLIVQQAATLDELTGGRAEIVFSIGNFALLAQYGIEWQGTKPLARLREAHEVMRRFLSDGSIDFEGAYYRYSGLFTRLPRRRRPGSPRRSISRRCRPTWSSGTASSTRRSGRSWRPSCAEKSSRRSSWTTAEVGERLPIAGTPEEWVNRVRSDVVPESYGHMALGLVDPSLIESWSGARLEGLPDLRSQLELFATRVAPALKET